MYFYWVSLLVAEQLQTASLYNVPHSTPHHKFLMNGHINNSLLDF
jgi:hypothetical protein